MDFRIIPMERIHLSQVAELEKKSFSCPWTLEQLQESMCRSEYHFLVAEGQEKRVLGFGSMIKVHDEGFINNIAVLPQFHRQGVASKILDTFCQNGKGELVFLTLEVRKSNQPAIALYEKFSFVTMGERKKYYVAPVEDALIMTRNFLSN